MSISITFKIYGSHKPNTVSKNGAEFMLTDSKKFREDNQDQDYYDFSAFYGEAVYSGVARRNIGGGKYLIARQEMAN